MRSFDDFLALTHRLRAATPRALLSEARAADEGGGGGDAGDGGSGTVFGALAGAAPGVHTPLWPLPVGAYPAFHGYPKVRDDVAHKDLVS